MSEGHKERSPDLGQEIRASEECRCVAGEAGSIRKSKESRNRRCAVYRRSPTAGSEACAGCEHMRQYLLFRHYYTADLLRLHAASFCKRHLLCPLCAIRRGAKALKAYLDRWEVIRAENPRLKPFLVTLTVKDGDDLAERFRHLHESQRALWMRKHRGRSVSSMV